MRIISGEYKGRNFTTKLPAGIRPTQDAMRETIFNILNNYIEFENKNVADVCAGSGMLGVEALSRGADFVYFVDKSRKAIDYISNNLELLFTNNQNSVPNNLRPYKLMNLDCLQFLGHLSNAINAGSPPIDLLFLDPPYKTNIVNEVLELINEYKLNEMNILSSNGIIIAETGIHNTLLIPASFELLTERQFGASKINFLRQNI